MWVSRVHPTLFSAFFYNKKIYGPVCNIKWELIGLKNQTFLIFPFSLHKNDCIE